MACSTWRSSREKEGSTSSDGWRPSGTPAVPAGRPECCVEKSSRSRRPRPFRSTPTVRSRAGFLSPCGAAKARCACSHELAADEHLDDVELRRDALEDGSAKMPAAVAAERVRDVRESALLVDQVDALIGGETGRDPLLEVEADELAVGGRDLFSDDHVKTGVHLAKAESTLDRVVVGDADRAELRLASELGEAG